MAEQFTGKVEIQNIAQNTTILLDGNSGNATLGGNGENGDLQLRSSAGEDTIYLGGENSTMLLGNAIRLEGNRERIVSKNLLLRSSAGENTIYLDGDNSTILLGGTLELDGETGSIVLKDWTLSVPDYVFEEDYKLKELDELRTYIDRHKHLPEIPSAQEIRKEGVNLGEFCMSMLKKVEELSLYVLQQHEIIKTQSEQLSKLEQSMSI